jgi:glycosyltransferase involved in cell wall biosynthesis
MINRKYSILLIASWYPLDSNSSEGSFIKEQAEMLSSYGHKVTVIHPYLFGSFKDSIGRPNKITCKNEITGNVIRIGIAPPVPKLRGLAYRKLFQSVLKTLKSLNIKKDDFDLIHSHALFMAGFIGIELSNKWQLPIIHTEHTSGLIFSPKQYNFLDKRIIKKVFQTANFTLFVSHFAKTKTLKHWQITPCEKHIVLSNLVHYSFFNAPISFPTDNHFSYLLIGNLIPRKGISNLINAWRIVITKFPNSLLTIAGEGPQKEILIKLVHELRLNDSITFIPGLSRENIINQISKTHVLVSSSELETFGLTVAEAQAMGKPVVVTDSGGVQDIVTSLTGIITKQDKRDFANGLIQIQQDFNQFNPIDIRNYAQSRFSTKAIMETLEALYNKI